MSGGHGDFVPRNFVVAEFATAEALLAGTRMIREKGHENVDTHTPFPVHGLEEALGITKLRIPTIVFCAGIAGVCAAYSMMFFMNVIDFPINVANRPPHSAPMFIPITFELMVLFAGISAFVGSMVLFGLPQPYHPVFEWENFHRASIDGFFLSVEVPAGGDANAVATDVRGAGASEATVIVEPER
jgi:hypothetical protein